MRIEFHNAFSRPQVAEITRLVAYDQLDNPIAILLELGPDLPLIATTAEHHPEEFNSLLRQLGLDRTVIVKNAAQIPLSQLRFDQR